MFDCGHDMRTERVWVVGKSEKEGSHGQNIESAQSHSSDNGASFDKIADGSIYRQFFVIMFKNVFII